MDEFEVILRDSPRREVAKVVDCLWRRLEDGPFDCSESVVVGFVGVDWVVGGGWEAGGGGGEAHADGESEGAAGAFVAEGEVQLVRKMAHLAVCLPSVVLAEQSVTS